MFSTTRVVYAAFSDLPFLPALRGPLMLHACILNVNPLQYCYKLKYEEYKKQIPALAIGVNRICYRNYQEGSRCCCLYGCFLLSQNLLHLDNERRGSYQQKVAAFLNNSKDVFHSSKSCLLEYHKLGSTSPVCGHSGSIC
eukprot:TRINITY_DN2578_c0_g1_i1.p2 TRINITY_DN2578_c0_g1~~TRINITY_DN2578_c0_g1_i1.p2  ORF type:complete len:140 (-),score=8.13 TRINITY_DN2578_c0_g1_i1:304-723(-)